MNFNTHQKYENVSTQCNYLSETLLKCIIGKTNIANTSPSYNCKIQNFQMIEMNE